MKLRSGNVMSGPSAAPLPENCACGLFYACPDFEGLCSMCYRSKNPHGAAIKLSPLPATANSAAIVARLKEGFAACKVPPSFMRVLMSAARIMSVEDTVMVLEREYQAGRFFLASQATEIFRAWPHCTDAERMRAIHCIFPYVADKYMLEAVPRQERVSEAVCYYGEDPPVSDDFPFSAKSKMREVVVTQNMTRRMLGLFAYEFHPLMH